MLFSQLEYLVALAKEGHFSRAAEECHVSQPALSSGIRKLEAELDVQIVRRANRYEGLTDEGQRLVDWARKILADRHALVEEIRTMRDGLSGVLNLGSIPTALPALTLLTGPLRSTYPLVRLSLLSLSSVEIRRALIEFEIDAAVSYLEGQYPAGVRTIPLYRERYVLLASADRVAPTQESMSWAVAASMRLCLLTPDMMNRKFLDEVFASLDCSPQIVMETNSISTLYAHVRDGSTSTIMPHTWLQTFRVPGDMRVVPLVEPIVTHGVGLLLPDQQPESMLSRALIRVVRQVNMTRALDDTLRQHLRLGHLGS
ncbi:LysR family transcriptional regulator [Amycolatopsis sp.]|jgi:DNA-binding transcriptional LysR family regulator|uniref:LysR family transcriptional regulator n=1 Tax=Amycolatopsis sp. TaxID=37632 RepID=UPI002DFCFB28|nr:LysR family transcriptional regulator [Amycolatopsis sp.]